MGRLFLMSLEGKIYSCKHCRAHLGVADNIISKSVDMTATFTFSASDVDFDANFLSYGDITSRPMLTKHSFHCKHGKAYLFNKVVNVTIGTKEDRMMTTGMHTVSDVFCVGCGSIVGWKYEAAHEKAQKYKEGKVVLERYKLTGPDGSQYWIAHGAHMGGSDADDA